MSDDKFKPFSNASAVLSIDATALSSFLNYMQQDGVATISTRTTLTTTNNEPATFATGTPVLATVYGLQASVTQPAVQLPIPGTGSVAPTKSDLIAQNAVFSHANPYTVNYEQEAVLGSEGVQFTVVPSIGTRTLELGIIAQINSATGVTELGRPLLSTRNFNGRVSLLPNQTFKLCSYDKLSKVKQVRGVAGLKDLPLIGQAFRKESESCHWKKVIVFLTPTVRNQRKYESERIDQITTKDDAWSTTSVYLPKVEGPPISIPNPRAPGRDYPPGLSDTPLDPLVPLTPAFGKGSATDRPKNNDYSSEQSILPL